MEGAFRDRREAGRRLARALAEHGYCGDGLLILGIPRGGVPVADEVARELHAPLDVVISRKLRAPNQPELAIGAVVGGEPLRILNEEMALAVGATPEYLQEETRFQQAEIERRMSAYRGDRPLPVLEGRTVVVVDDGIATGYTFRAALAGLRREHPARLVAAVPVGPPESIAALAALADDVVCLATPEPFWAVGIWYQEFSQTSDEEVFAILRDHWAGERGEMRPPVAQSQRSPAMSALKCPRHEVAMKMVPAEPRSRCVNCGYVTHQLGFAHCRECGQRMHIEEPEPHWRCPVCHPVPEYQQVAAIR